MTNREKLRELMTDILILNDQEFSLSMTRDKIETWDSLAVVAIAAGVEEVFAYHMTPDEAVSVTGVADLVRILEREGISFGEV